MSDHRVAVWFVTEDHEYEPIYTSAMKPGDIPRAGDRETTRRKPPSL